MSKDTGGNAFPTHEFVDGVGDSFDSGMTLRDYFAAKAMRGQLSFPSNLYQALRWAVGLSFKSCGASRTSIAEDAYMQADYMLVERAK